MPNDNRSNGLACYLKQRGATEAEIDRALTPAPLTVGQRVRVAGRGFGTLVRVGRTIVRVRFAGGMLACWRRDCAPVQHCAECEATGEEVARAGAYLGLADPVCCGGAPEIPGCPDRGRAATRG